ncbi:hypothetical protein HWV00_14760 [Moritella sp. 24]|uniref:hypothetical protein n=1 Tax=Moritella sp. 24 TaxID=2746230 RepID=UPI001BA4B2AE|nr:hypothetical protein [Moritella sp. 24]QUM77378.1 hypothetical protein HWV00_14760 [Moritella sp. 24]
MLSNIELDRQLKVEQEAIDSFVHKAFDTVKLEFSARMRKKNAKKIAVAAAAYVVGKAPYVGSLLSAGIKKLGHDKTSGEILDAALTLYHTADIYSKEINSEVTEKTLRKFVKAHFYIQLADGLMDYINHENEAFIQAVKMQHQVKTPVVMKHLKVVLKQPDSMEMDTF